MIRRGRHPFVIGRLSQAVRLSTSVAASAVLTLTASLLSVPPAAAAPADPEPLKPQVVKLGEHGREVAGQGWKSSPRPKAELPDPVWPAAGTAIKATVKPAKRTAAANSAKAVAPAVTTAVVDRDKVPQRWREGVVVKVSARDAGSAALNMDYSKFQYAYGADWASRLRWFSLPDCALTTPDAAGCSATPLASRNDTANTTVSADVPVKAASVGVSTMTVALAAAASGSSGDFGATPLSASATWSAGGSTGDFTWSYPMRAPNGIQGPQPSLSLSYSSSSVDGRSSASNNQPSWIGEGFEFSPGFIERRYVTCDDDKSGDANNPEHSFDQCWRSNNATLSFAGSSTELVYEPGKGWHGRSENGSKIELKTGTSNGDNDGEFWKLTTTDGVQYFFGKNQLDGHTAETDSTWTTPVYGNHPNEPCHEASFAASDCKQAWRWNLDYAIDTHGNTISYWYDKEINRYAAQGKATNLVDYVRGGTLSRIDYGTWDRGSADRSVSPLAQVNFTVQDRCKSDCTDHDAEHWPDTPWDQECKASDSSCNDYSPTYWSTKRLTKIATRVWDTTQTPAAWQNVDSWAMEHSFPSPGDGDNPGLWLDSVTHTGHVGGTAKMPPVTFDPVAKPNRVLTGTNTSNNWHRIGNIHTETGAVIQVTYSLPDCSAGNLPSSPHNNSRRCYPVIGPDPYSTSGGDITEWWHKYVVTQVSETDTRLADRHQAPTKNTYYTYEGTPAWHYADDDGLSKPKYRTWNQFRGYKSVLTRVGEVNATLTKAVFFRGMHGDRSGPSGGTEPVTVSASLGDETVYDHDQFAGMIREQIVYNGTEDKPVSKTVKVPWRSAATATRDDVTARFVNTQTEYSATALGVDGSRGWRVTSTHTTFDPTYGLPEKVQSNGDITKTGDEKCTTTVYNRNTTKHIVALPRRVTTTALACGAEPTSAAHVIDDALTFYDGADSATTPPEKGDLTRTDLMKDWAPATGTTWLISGRSTFDAFGRVNSETDVRGNVTTTAYSPAKSLVTQTKQTTDMGWETTTAFNPAWSAPTKITDINSRVTDVAYDPLGRTAQTWDAGWTRAAHPDQPLTKYSYVFDAARSTYPYVKTETLNAAGGTDISYAIYDGWLRPRQTQKAAAGIGGGRVVTDTIYDEFGNASLSYGAHAEQGTPSGTLLWVHEWYVPSQNVTVFDRAGRVTDTIFRAGTADNGGINLVEKWRTTTRHEGDRTTVVPPAGGTPTTTITDVLGRTTELRQYTTAAGIAGGYLATTYAYNNKNSLSSVADSAGDEWTYKYDLLGRQTEAVDPDKGKTTSTYNDYGDLTTTKDALDQVLVYAYDKLGRKTAVYNTAVADANKRAEWIYDKLYSGATVRGQLTQAIRYDIAADGTRQPYKWQARGFTVRNQVSGAHYSIPAAETGLAGTWVYSYGFSAFNGAPTTMTYPAGGGLTTETITTNYDPATGLPKSLDTNLGGVNSYVVGRQYTAYGEPTTTTLKINGGVYAEQSVAYELDTRRVHQVQVKPDTSTGTVADRTYQYQASGLIDLITDTPQVGQADNQCFTYDHLQRLTSAWTPKTGINCSATPTVADLGGPAPYWTDWTLDNLGNRTKEVNHTTAGDTVHTYTVPAAGPSVARPHAVTGMTTTRPDQSSTTVGYTYDATGNMTSRPGETATQTLTWDAEGKPVKTVEGAKVTTSLYDADGTRLIRRDNTGSTLFLPGMEVRRTGTATTANAATRYYSFAGGIVASRTNASQSLAWLFGDHQGTQQIAVNAYTQQVSIRRQTPYGSPRGTNPMWPNAKGFVGGDIDPTGLVHIGAREYDPALGRFISVDPVQDLTDPQQWNAYVYANNNPITYADPTGMLIDVGNGIVYNPYTNETSGGGTSGGNSGSTGSSSGGNTSGGTGGGTSSSSGGSSTSGSSGGAAPVKKKAWWQRAGDWISDNKNSLIGAGVGIVTFVGCTAVTGPVGAVPCMGVAGAASQVTTDYLNGDINSASDLLSSANTGVGNGLLAVPLAAADAVDQAEASYDNFKEGDVAGGLGHGALAALDVVGVVGGVGAIKGSLGKCTHSFAPGTAVLLADGTTKPIEQVEVGDEVLATDPDSGHTTPQSVEALHKNVDEEFADVTVTADGRTSVLQTTAHHPFWNQTIADWTNAEDLKFGDWLRTADGGTAVVKQVRTFDSARHMYDLTVANVHTYYVFAGKAPVLVHNCGDLVGDAAKFPGSHVLDEHVNATSRQAINLASKKKGPNSVFIDRQTAQQVVDYALAGNQRKIQNWLRGSDQQLPLRGRFGAPNSIGTVYRADGSSSPAGNGYFLLLQRAKGHSGGYYVHTAYPE